MNRSDSVGALAAALSKAQGEFAAVPMNSKNGHLGNRYANLGDVIATAKPVLARNGLAVSQTEFGGDGMVGVSTILFHSSGEWITDSMSLPLGEQKGLNTAQVAGSIISYLRRYCYASILGLYADEDTDGGNGDSTHKPPAARQAAPAPSSGRRPIQQAPPPDSPPASPAPQRRGMTKDQKEAAWQVAKALGWGLPELQAFVAEQFRGSVLAALTEPQGDELVTMLTAKLAKTPKQARMAS